MRQRHVIDTWKGLTPLVTLGLMAAWGRWDSPTLWLYLATHGTYGLMWVLKSRNFGDAQWESPATPGRALLIAVGLSAYWLAPWLIASRGVEAPPWLMGAAVSTWGLGVFLHFAADMQKHAHLAARSGRLLQTGLWSRLRNPNYLGELLVYGGFSALAAEWAWVPLSVLALSVAVEWVPNMRRKDRSLARYPDFAAWRARSWLWIPLVW